MPRYRNDTSWAVADDHVLFCSQQILPANSPYNITKKRRIRTLLIKELMSCQAEVVLQKMLVMLQQPHKESMKTIHAKYSHKVDISYCSVFFNNII